MDRDFRHNPKRKYRRIAAPTAEEIARRYSNYHIALHIFGLLVLLAILGLVIWLLVHVIHNSNVVQTSLSGMEEVEDDSCDDGNPCTSDLLRGGKCVNRNCPSTVNCTASCYAEESGVCSDGECVGLTCAGQCTNSSNCPALDINSGYDTVVDCNRGQCVYSTLVVNPPFVDSIVVDDDDDVGNGTDPLREPCVPGPLLEKYCISFISNNNTWKECVGTEVRCAPFAVDDVKTSGFALVVCRYFFTCSEPTFNFYGLPDTLSIYNTSAETNVSAVLI